MFKKCKIILLGIAAIASTLVLRPSPVQAVDLNLAAPTIDTVNSRGFSADSYYLIWAPSPDVVLPDYFKINTTGPNGFSSTNQTINGSAVNFVIPNLSPNTQYTFIVEAFYNGDGGAQSVEHSGYTKALPPAMPTVGEITTSSISVVMMPDNNNPPNTKYLLYLSDGKDDLFLDENGNQSINIADAYKADASTWGQLKFAAVGLVPNSTYWFGAMSVSEDAAFNSSPQTPDYRTKMLPPLGALSAGINTSTLVVRWTAPQAGETKFVGEISDDDGKTFTIIPSVGGPRLWSEIFNNLLPNKKYIVGVATADDDGHQSDFTLAPFAYTMPLAPEIPLVDEPRITAHSIPLIMVPSAGNPTSTRYSFITRNGAGDGSFLDETGKMGMPFWQTAEQWAHTNYFATGLEPNTQYFFNAAAITDDDFQYSYSSLEVSATTSAEVAEPAPTPAPARGGGNPGPLIYTNLPHSVPTSSDTGIKHAPSSSSVIEPHVLGEKIAADVSIDELIKQTSYGQRGDLVKHLQTKLRTAGFFPHWVRSTGWYGPITRAAVAKYLVSIR